jgi:alpha-beta hydrolase superfamily lysophospholipase
MRKIYIAVFLVFVLSVFLFVVSFIYLDKHNHTVRYYNIYLNNQYTGISKVDRFVTEEKIIYKSVSSTPFRELFTEKHIRIDLSGKYALEYYQKELFANGVQYFSCIENKSGMILFLSRFMSRFSYLGNVPIRNSTFMFEEDAPVTYMPIIENYDFKIGGPQGFSALICMSDAQLPPIKRFVTLTSIRDEYIKIGRRKIKVENLLLKIKSLPQGNVLVAKSDKSLIMVDVPSIGLRIVRTFEPKEFFPKEEPAARDSYISKNVTFSSKGRQLSGTLTIPKGDGPFPAVLLIWGSGPQNRNYEGVFSAIADYLPNYGYCVLRFDKRGVGSSGGDASSVTPDEQLEDITAALNFLRLQGNVNKERLSVIAHSKGALSAIRLAANNQDIKGLVLMAPSLKLDTKNDEELLRSRAAKERWGSEYLSLALASNKQTKDIVNSTKRDWAYILGKKCYLKAMRDEDAIKASEVLARITAPVLILQGKADTEVPSEFAARIDRWLSEHGNTKHAITYFDTLGHFFGKLINDGTAKICRGVDKEVLSSIRNWLNMNTIQVISPEEPK